MSESIREEHIFMAKLCEQAERYEEMVETMKKIVDLNVELTIEERNMLSVAYKNVIGSRRAAYRILSSREQKDKNDETKVRLIRSYKQKIEGEIRTICHDIVAILNSHLTQLYANTMAESRVFYYRMLGDYWRYVEEISTGEARTEARKQSTTAYNTSEDIAKKELHSCHVIRLSSALSQAMYHHEMLNMTEKACEIAQTAFDEALAEIDTICEESYQECCIIMQLLRDNLILWRAQLEDGAKGKEELKEHEDSDEESEEDND